MIGESDTLAARPPSNWASGYAKGTATTVTINPRVRGLSRLYDDFDNVKDWVNVHGRLRVSGGASSDVATTGIGYSAGYHKTQLLSDNCRAKVTIQDGIVLYGESRVVICADPKFNRYYGMAIRKNLLNAQVSIIRGLSSISIDKYNTTTVALNPGDRFEVWYDRLNSTVRIYQNDSEIAARYFPPNDIPHGPGCRYTGVVMGTNWLVDVGPNFDDFEAWDVARPAPLVYDPVDSRTVNPNWVEVSNQVEVHRHLLFPLSLGPKNAVFTTAAIRWNTPMNSDSVKSVVTIYRLGITGQYTLVVRSNSTMTNWIGVRFDIFTNKIQVVTGTSPTTVTTRGSAATWQVLSVGQQFTVTWDEPSKTIRCYRCASRNPLVSWSAGSSFNGSGRYVGMTWMTGLGTTGVEPNAFNAYDVSADQPLP